MARNAIQPAGLHKPAHYSPAIKAGNTLYVAGQVAMDVNGNLVGKGDFEAQGVQVFENLKAILAAAGGTLDDVVKLNSYVTDLKHRLAFVELRQRYFNKPYPASTFVVITSLASPDYLLEVEAIAVLGKS